MPLPVVELGPYRLLEVLGTGAMGTVYLADDLEEERRVALKVLRPHLLLKKDFFQRFQREALTGERVSHPNVVRTLDCGIHALDETPYCLLVMEYVEGRTLREVLRELGPLPEARIRDIGCEIAAGLGAIHEAGAVHRDLKPENVIITPSQQARILDLGVARLPDIAAGLTRDDQFAGSLGYAAPEQFQSCHVGPSSDLYALGIVLYELGCGVNPFALGDFAAVSRAHRDSVPRRLDEVRPSISANLAQVIATLLEKRPSRRFASATDLRRALEDGENSEWWSRQRARAPPRTPAPTRCTVRRDTALYGRTPDLARLRASWQQACAGYGNVLLIRGEAGIGKTRLVDSFLAEVAEERARVFYGAFAPEDGAGTLSPSLRARYGLPTLETALRAAHAQLVYGVEAPEPVLWIVEDLHCASDGERSRLWSLARTVVGHRILLVITTRPELEASVVAEYSLLPHVRQLSLPRLRVREVVHLLEEAFGGATLAERHGPPIARRTDGVPLLVVEMARELRRGGALHEGPEGPHTSTCVVDRVAKPRAVEAFIEERLRALTDAERQTLEVCAVGGFEFDPGLVATALGRTRLALLQSLAIVERRTGIVRSDVHAYRFDLHLIQETLQSRQPARRRAHHHMRLAMALSERIADEISGEEHQALAWHHLHGRFPNEARTHVLPALAHLARACRNELAIELATRALGIHGVLEGRLRLEVLIHLSRRLDLLGLRSRQRAAVTEASILARRLGDPSARARALVAEAHLALAGDDYGRVRITCRRALTLARQGTGTSVRLEAATILGVALSRMGMLARAKRLHEAVAARARAIGDQEREAAATIHLGSVLLDLARPDEAQGILEEGLGLAERCRSAEWQVIALTRLQDVPIRRDDLEGARVRVEFSLQLARSVGARSYEARGLLQLGKVCEAAGDREEAERRFARGLVLYGEVGSRMGQVDALRLLGCVSRGRGDFDAARLHLRDSLALAHEIGNPLAECMALGEFGRVLEGEGRPQESLALLERQFARTRALGIS